MPTPARRPTARPWPTLAAAVTVTALALTLWGLAAWQLVTTAHAAATAERAAAEVVGCGSDPIGPGCTVRYRTSGGRTVTRAVDRPGLVAVVTGDDVPVWIAPDGSIGLAGWRPWADAALLTGLALAMSSGATRWLGKALRAGDELTAFDLGEEGGRDARMRDVG